MAKDRSTPYHGSCTFQYSQQKMARAMEMIAVTQYHHVGVEGYPTGCSLSGCLGLGAVIFVIDLQPDLRPCKTWSRLSSPSHMNSEIIVAKARPNWFRAYVTGR